jgi:hypothetical protein
MPIKGADERLIQFFTEFEVNASNGYVDISSSGDDSYLSLSGNFIQANSKNCSIIMNSSENDGTIELSTDSGSSNSRVILTSHSNMTTSQCSVGSSGILLVYGAPTALGSIHLKDGEMQLSMGLPFIGSEISMKPDSITLKVGPLTSLTLTPDGIVLSSGATKLALGVQGIKEEMGPITRSLGIMGHSLAAAESAVDVGVIGVNAKGPTGSFAFNATGQLSALLLTESADAIMSQKAALASTSS